MFSPYLQRLQLRQGGSYRVEKLVPTFHTRPWKTRTILPTLFDCQENGFNLFFRWRLITFKGNVFPVLAVMTGVL